MDLNNIFPLVACFYLRSIPLISSLSHTDARADENLHDYIILVIEDRSSLTTGDETRYLWLQNWSIWVRRRITIYPTELTPACGFTVVRVAWIQNKCVSSDGIGRWKTTTESQSYVRTWVPEPKVEEKSDLPSPDFSFCTRLVVCLRTAHATWPRVHNQSGSDRI